ncbi:MAG TPA: ribonuclease P protein component, partial [Gemmatimonadaceae bacterium]|nr:ribonuclease P protein component [Gemmatimonadaceae bacterium]
RSEHLDVRATDSLLSHARVAVIVGKHGHTIVERNQLRRRLRELARTQIIPIGIQMDVVIRSVPSAYDATFDQLSREIGTICVQLKEYGVEK